MDKAKIKLNPVLKVMIADFLSGYENIEDAASDDPLVHVKAVHRRESMLAQSEEGK